MKTRLKHIKDKIKDQNGLVIVEATIVFPIMFFVLFFIIFIGNLYFEQAKVDAVVESYAVKGAEYVADPNLYYVDRGAALPTEVRNMDIEPYRYIIGSISNGKIKEIETSISNEVKNKIADGSMIFFSNQRVSVVGSDNDKIAKFKNYVVYSTFVVQVNYEIKFPIRFLMESEPVIARLSSRSEVSVSDAPEFIRNVDMVVDLLDGTDTSENIKGIFDKINGFIEKFSK